MSEREAASERTVATVRETRGGEGQPGAKLIVTATGSGEAKVVTYADFGCLQGEQMQASPPPGPPAAVETVG